MNNFHPQKLSSYIQDLKLTHDHSEKRKSK